MIFGPVLPIELLTSSRRTRYFIVRLVYVVALFLTLWSQYETSLGWGTGNPVSLSDLSRFAREFFESFTLVQVTAVLLVTPAIMAGTIAEEKERRTLEYLLVTDLRNQEIVLGKLAARFLQLLMLLSAGWPMLAILLLLGGVSIEQFLASSIITASTAMVVASLSLWCSVQARRGRDAVMRVYVIGLALLILPAIFEALTGSTLLNWPLAQVIADESMAANPYVAFNKAWGQGGVVWDHVFYAVRNQLALAVPGVLLAVVQVRRVYLRQTFGQPVRRPGLRWRLWRPALGDSPVIWKELHAERAVFSLGVVGSAAQALLFLAVLIPAVYLFLKAMSQTGPSFIDEFKIFVIVVGTMVACVGLLSVAVRAATCVTSERERQTWDVLISTPLDAWQIVSGKLVGSLYAMRGLMALLLVLVGLGAIAGKVWFVMVPVFLVELAVFALFVAVLGVLFSLNLSTSLRAMAATVGTSVFLGGGYFFCCMPLLWVDGDLDEFLLAGCVPFLLGVPLAIEPKNLSLSQTSEEVRFLFTCALGVTLYFIGVLLLGSLVWRQFDRTFRSFAVPKFGQGLAQQR